MTTNRSFSFACCAISITLLGCSSSNPQAPARVSGSLSYNGQPIKAGRMQFHSAEGTVYEAQISPDGTYSATDIAEGEMVVTIETESINPDKKLAKGGRDAAKRMAVQGQQQPPPGMPSAPDVAGYYIKIPDKYSKKNTSPLTVTLESGRQVHNFELTD